MKKRNKVVLIISAILIALALIFLILGFALSGADILGWFGSKWAMLIYIVLGLWAILITFLFVGDKIKKL